ncbi:hypothetical protein DRN86_02840, partial [Candidatus Geothermarchaeota archaeon]
MLKLRINKYLNGLRPDPEILRLLTDPNNRAILNLCSDKARRPTELAEILGRTRPAVDKRAKQLKEKNLLSDFFDEKGRKFYITTDVGRWYLENYPAIGAKKEILRRPYRLTDLLIPLSRILKPSLFILILFTVVAIGGYVNLAYQ